MPASQTHSAASASRLRNARHEALALQLAAHCTTRPLEPALSDSADECLLFLARAAEERVRLALANRLADCPWAPSGVMRYLANDTLSVAEPVLRRCLALSDDDLVALAATTIERRRLIAERLEISATVTAALARHRESDVLRTLARNGGARLDDRNAPDFAAVAEADAELQLALASRDDLTVGFAAALVTVAGDHIARQLRARFPELPARALRKLVQSAASDAMEQETEAGAASQALRMQQAGQLTAAAAIRCLQDGRQMLFDHALARLCEMPVADWRRALAGAPVRACALAGRTLVIEAAAVRPMLRALADAGRVHAISPADATQAVEGIYTLYGRDDARKALHRLGAGGSIAH